MSQSKSIKATLLIVDDEPLVRAVAAEHLRDEGFDVVEAKDASEAIDQLTSRSDIRLVFSDINMPGDRDGFGLAEWIVANKASVDVVLTSGVFRNLPLPLVGKGIPLWPKPYHLDEIAAHIDARLARHREKASS